MNTIGNRLIRTLENLAISSTQEGSSATAEIYAVSEETGILKDMLEGIHSEAFISTSLDYGLSLRESRFGETRSDMAVADRRIFLIRRNRLMCNCISPSMYINLFLLLGCTCTVIKDSSSYALTFNVSGTFTPVQKALIKGHIKNLFPMVATKTINFN